MTVQPGPVETIKPAERPGCWFTECPQLAEPEHTPCCSTHGRPLCHACYRRTHFVEVCNCGRPECEPAPVESTPDGGAGEWPAVWDELPESARQWINRLAAEIDRLRVASSSVLASEPGETRSREACMAAAAALEAFAHEVEDSDAAELAARRADQWRAEAETPEESAAIVDRNLRAVGSEGLRPVVSSPVQVDGESELRQRLRAAASVAFRGPHDTDASLLAGAAWKLGNGYEAGGSNVKAAIARVLRVVAEVVAS